MTEVTIEDPKAVLDALERYKKENQKFREERDEYKTKAERGAALERRLIETEARSRLSTLGIKDADRLMKYVQLDDVTINNDGEVEGLDERIKTVQEDFPELFDPRLRVGGQADTNAGAREDGKPLSASEVQAAMLLRKRV